MSNPDALLYLMEFSALMVTALLLFVTMTYLSMAIGHLFRRRIIMSVVAFIGLDIVGTLYIDWVDEWFAWDYMFEVTPHSGFLVAIAVMLAACVLLTAGTVWILGHRLNLE